MKKKKIMKPSMQAMRMMAKAGGLKGYMNGGDVTDPLIKAQKGIENPKMVYQASPYWADKYSIDTTGLSKNSANYYPYSRSNGTKGVFTRGETKILLDKIKKEKLKNENYGKR
jgi:hypothetical protein